MTQKSDQRIAMKASLRDTDNSPDSKSKLRFHRVHSVNPNNLKSAVSRNKAGEKMILRTATILSNDLVDS